MVASTVTGERFSMSPGGRTHRLPPRPMRLREGTIPARYLSGRLRVSDQPTTEGARGNKLALASGNPLLATAAALELPPPCASGTPWH